MAMTLEQIVHNLNERHLTGDSAKILAWAQTQKEVLEQAERAIADAQQELEILRTKVDDAEKLFDAAQARLGDKALGQAEVMAILGVTPAPTQADPTFAPPPPGPVPPPPAGPIPTTPIEETPVEPTPGPVFGDDVSAATEPVTTAKDVLVAAAQSPIATQILADLADRVTAPQDLPTTPPTAPVAE